MAPLKDGTLIKDVQRWRSQGVDYKLFVNAMEDIDMTGTTSATTAAQVQEDLAQATYSSPKLRYLCYIVREVVCVRNQKLLISVEWLVVQLFLETVSVYRS